MNEKQETPNGLENLDEPINLVDDTQIEEKPTIASQAKDFYLKNKMCLLLGLIATAIVIAFAIVVIVVAVTGGYQDPRQGTQNFTSYSPTIYILKVQQGLLLKFYKR